MFLTAPFRDIQEASKAHAHPPPLFIYHLVAMRVLPIHSNQAGYDGSNRRLRQTDLSFCNRWVLA